MRKNGKFCRKMENYAEMENFVEKLGIIAKVKDGRQKKRETEQKGKKRKGGGRGEKRGVRKGEWEKRLERNVSDKKYDKGPIRQTWIDRQTVNR